MNSGFCKGKLLRWNDERGFGFIESETDPKGVFLHISALGRTPRRPQVGDVILYKRVRQSDGKVKAEKASIQGMSHHAANDQRTRRQPSQRFKRGRKPTLVTKLIGLGTLAIVGTIFSQFQPSTSPPPITAVNQPNCTIKGNISVSSGKKWYHLPGMEDYTNTVIDRSKGERWFCSEQDAIAAGWQKAPQ
ncbi:MAG: cold shock domain-containing protein [Leptolyngbyaceae cyanobacterium]